MIEIRQAERSSGRALASRFLWHGGGLPEPPRSDRRLMTGPLPPAGNLPRIPFSRNSPQRRGQSHLSGLSDYPSKC
jgi:hypothetical protein